MMRGIVAVCFAVLATSAMAQGLRGDPQLDAPVVSFTLSEEIVAEADHASFSASISSDDDDADAAMRANGTASAAVIAALRTQGVAEADIHSRGVTLGQRRNYRTGAIRGYTASNRIEVETRDIGRVGLFIGALVAAGGTSLDGPRFERDDMNSVVNPGRERLYQQGLAVANAYARTAGYARVRPVAISETVSDRSNYDAAFEAMAPAMDAAATAADAAAEELAPPIASTDVRRTLRVELIFRLER
ncbi:MAG: SIMPL domain-containing protein [Sphingopyxis sp.]